MSPSSPIASAVRTGLRRAQALAGGPVGTGDVSLLCTLPAGASDDLVGTALQVLQRRGEVDLVTGGWVLTEYGQRRCR